MVSTLSVYGRSQYLSLVSPTQVENDPSLEAMPTILINHLTQYKEASFVPSIKKNPLYLTALILKVCC